MNSQPNGKLQSWLLGALLSLLLILIPLISGLFVSRLAAAESAINEVEEDQKEHGERIAVTETYIREVNRRLEAMDRKLDKALQ